MVPDAGLELHRENRPKSKPEANNWANSCARVQLVGGANLQIGCDWLYQKLAQHRSASGATP
jgi:hypothetical protein